MRRAVAVGLVLALAGVLFTVSAQLARGTGGRHPEDLAQLVESESRRADGVQSQVDALRADVDRLRAEQPTAAPTGDAAVMGEFDLEAGLEGVSGPGLTVALSDAPQDGTYPDGVRPDDLVVHQQDMQAVIDALWAGGAEAMMLMDQRVTATTAFRCVGNVLSLGGRLYSPPFTVTAVGDPAALRAALDRSPEIQVYQQYVKAVQLGWKVTTDERIEMPAADLPVLREATLPAGVGPFDH